MRQISLDNTSHNRYNLNGPDAAEPLLAVKGNQYVHPDGRILIGVAWRGDLLLWDTREQRPRPISVFRDQGVTELDKEKHLLLTEKYIQAQIAERERKMGMRIYSGRNRV